MARVAVGDTGAGAQHARRHNLTVAGLHTYYVGDNPILVHNAACPQPTGGGGGPSHGPDFVAHPNGEIVPVPTGATGPSPANNGAGFQYQGGSGGHGLDPRTSGVRIMDPHNNPPHPQPNGYVKYNNEAGQTVDPNSGRTVPKADPWAHWGWGPR